MNASHLLFLGTYTRSGPSRGIYAVRLDAATGEFSAPSLAAETADPTWIELSPDRGTLYAVQPSAAQVVAFRVDAAAGRLVPAAAPAPVPPGIAPCHLAVERTGRLLVAANYHDSFVAAIPLLPGGEPGAPRILRHAGRSVHPTRQEKAHVHSVTLSPDERFVIVADLGLDRLFTYVLDADAATLAPADPPWVATAPGAGPRHCKFSADGRFLYVINELDNTLATYAYDAARGSLSPRQVVPTLPPGTAVASTTAEVRLHPNGRFLYGSNRGHDSLAVFAIHPADGTLSLVEIVPSGGPTPRNFALSPDGRWLVCGHQGAALLTAFRVDPATGRLTRSPHAAAVPSCVCVAFHR